MISYAGIAIFLFGNKIKDYEVVFSEGLIQEFEIAKSNGLLLIPVGATGYATHEIYTKLTQEGYFDSLAFPKSAREHMDKLGDCSSNLSTIKETLISLLKALDKGE